MKKSTFESYNFQRQIWMLSQENLMTHSIEDGSMIVSYDDFTIDNLNVFFL